MRKFKKKNEQNNPSEKTTEETSVTHKHPIEIIMETALSKIKTMIDTSTVIGEKIETKNGKTIIPISKVSVGFVAGGGEYRQNIDALPFAGGSGAGFSVSPIGFAIIEDEDIRILKVEPNETFEKIVETIPEILKVISKKISAEKRSKNEKNEL